METSANGIYYADETMGHPDLTSTAGSLVTLLNEILPLAGFSIAFSGTNKAVYRPDDVEDPRLFLRVDDSFGSNARIRGYETMSDVDTGTGLFPTEAQVSGGFYFYKSNAATARPWRFFSDGRKLYFFNDNAGGNSWDTGFEFGSGNSYVANDVYDVSVSSGLSTNATWFFSTLNNKNYAYLARAYNQQGSSIGSARYSHGKTTSTMGNSGQPFPAPADNRLHIHSIEYWDSVDNARGILPGLWNPIHDADLPNQWEITNIPLLPGRTLVVQTMGSNRQCVVDKTGPWR